MNYIPPSYFPYYINLSCILAIIPDINKNLDQEPLHPLFNFITYRKRKKLSSELPVVEAAMKELKEAIAKDLHSSAIADEATCYSHAKSVYDLWNTHIKTVKEALTILGPDWVALLNNTHDLIPGWDKLPFEEGYFHALQKQ